jgi:hypothetical protein
VYEWVEWVVFTCPSDVVPMDYRMVAYGEWLTAHKDEVGRLLLPAPLLPSPSLPLALPTPPPPSLPHVLSPPTPQRFIRGRKDTDLTNSVACGLIHVLRYFVCSWSTCVIWCFSVTRSDLSISRSSRYDRSRTLAHERSTRVLCFPVTPFS